MRKFRQKTGSKSRLELGNQSRTSFFLQNMLLQDRTALDRISQHRQSTWHSTRKIFKVLTCARFFHVAIQQRVLTGEHAKKGAFTITCSKALLLPSRAPMKEIDTLGGRGGFSGCGAKKEKSYRFPRSAHPLAKPHVISRAWYGRTKSMGTPLSWMQSYFSSPGMVIDTRYIRCNYGYCSLLAQRRKDFKIE